MRDLQWGDDTYIAFMVLMFCGSLIAMCMLPMNKVWKSDGTRVMNMKFPSWKQELIDLYRMLVSEPRIFFVFPMFFASNWFYTYQFNDFNAGRFNIRTRSLNCCFTGYLKCLVLLYLGLFWI